MEYFIKCLYLNVKLQKLFLKFSSVVKSVKMFTKTNHNARDPDTVYYSFAKQ